MRLSDRIESSDEEKWDKSWLSKGVKFVSEIISPQLADMVLVCRALQINQKMSTASRGNFWENLFNNMENTL